VDQDVLIRTDPVTCGERRDLRTIEAGSVAIVQILESGALLKLCELLKARHAAVLAV
jgi:hypothetical protein